MKNSTQLPRVKTHCCTDSFDSGIPHKSKGLVYFFLSTPKIYSTAQFSLQTGGASLKGRQTCSCKQMHQMYENLNCTDSEEGFLRRIPMRVGSSHLHAARLGPERNVTMLTTGRGDPVIGRQVALITGDKGKGTIPPAVHMRAQVPFFEQTGGNDGGGGLVDQRLMQQGPNLREATPALNRLVCSRGEQIGDFREVRRGAAS